MCWACRSRRRLVKALLLSQWERKNGWKRPGQEISKALNQVYFRLQWFHVYTRYMFVFMWKSILVPVASFPALCHLQWCDHLHVQYKVVLVQRRMTWKRLSHAVASGRQKVETKDLENLSWASSPLPPSLFPPSSLPPPWWPNSLLLTVQDTR